MNEMLILEFVLCAKSIKIEARFLKTVINNVWNANFKICSKSIKNITRFTKTNETALSAGVSEINALVPLIYWHINTHLN